MGMKLPPKELELYKRCDEVLHYVWDPIGVAGVPQARDEYDSYLPQVFRMVVDGVSRERIVDHLVNVESEYMGLTASRSRAERAVDCLLDWWDWISERPS
jgi:hypothetical protein